MKEFELKKEGSGNLESLIISYQLVGQADCSQQLHILNDILISTYDAQVNMLHYRCAKKKKSMSFNKRILQMYIG